MLKILMLVVAVVLVGALAIVAVACLIAGGRADDRWDQR